MEPKEKQGEEEIHSTEGNRDGSLKEAFESRKSSHLNWELSTVVILVLSRHIL